ATVALNGHTAQIHSDEFVRFCQKGEEAHAKLVAKSIGVQLKVIDRPIKTHVLSRMCLSLSNNLSFNAHLTGAKLA
ncbi:MAG: hypothetical protein K8963_09520, partial [Proteobacteria bacterium]|nr:hypothetical protein [Pseudomonadota bacterium]